jgi:hypothetical protein
MSILKKAQNLLNNRKTASSTSRITFDSTIKPTNNNDRKHSLLKQKAKTAIIYDSSKEDSDDEEELRAYLSQLAKSQPNKKSDDKRSKVDNNKVKNMTSSASIYLKIKKEVESEDSEIEKTNKIFSKNAKKERQLEIDESSGSTSEIYPIIATKKYQSNPLSLTVDREECLDDYLNIKQASKFKSAVISKNSSISNFDEMIEHKTVMETQRSDFEDKSVKVINVSKCQDRKSISSPLLSSKFGNVMSFDDINKDSDEVQPPHESKQIMETNSNQKKNILSQAIQVNEIPLETLDIHFVDAIDTNIAPEENFTNQPIKEPGINPELIGQEDINGRPNIVNSSNFPHNHPNSYLSQTNTNPIDYYCSCCNRKILDNLQKPNDHCYQQGGIPKNVSPHIGNLLEPPISADKNSAFTATLHGQTHLTSTMVPHLMLMDNFVSEHLSLVQDFVRMNVEMSNIRENWYNQTSLEETKIYIEKNKPKARTYEECLIEVIGESR